MDCLMTVLRCEKYTRFINIFPVIVCGCCLFMIVVAQSERVYMLFIFHMYSTFHWIKTFYCGTISSFKHFRFSSTPHNHWATINVFNPQKRSIKCGLFTFKWLFVFCFGSVLFCSVLNVDQWDTSQAFDMRSLNDWLIAWLIDTSTDQTNWLHFKVMNFLVHSFFFFWMKIILNSKWIEKKLNWFIAKNFMRIKFVLF